MTNAIRGLLNRALKESPCMSDAQAAELVRNYVKTLRKGLTDFRSEEKDGRLLLHTS